MTSRERLSAAWRGGDPIPLTTWCFGAAPPADLTWSGPDGVARRFWYSLRMEHLHTLPQPWTLDDDFRRVLAWKSLGVDDLLDISVPWGRDPAVRWTDRCAPKGEMDPDHPVLVRDYQTPSGPLRHAVRKTGENPGAGWVIQPDAVPLLEDFNIPRGVRHPVTGPEDVERVSPLYAPPGRQEMAWFLRRAAEVKSFADREGIAVQAWSAFGMDAAVWLCGTEGAVLLAMDHPEAFGRLMEIIGETDRVRTELAASNPAIDLVVQRGWYSSTDFWSPDLFDEYVAPGIEMLARAVHRRGKCFGYVMTTGVEVLGPRLAKAGVDVLYFVDPVQDRLTLESIRRSVGGQMCLVGGTNAISLQSGDPARIRREVHEAVRVLGPTGRFILHPVDALFPDTPWAGVEALVQAWKECAGG